MKRIALTQRVELVPGRNERRDCLDQQWAQLLTQLGFAPVPLANCVGDVEAYLDSLRPAGVIFTGGNDLTIVDGAENTAPERDHFEHELLDVCGERGIPVLGVCRGLQTIITHYKGTLTKVEGHVATRHRVRFSETKLEAWPEVMEVNSYHQFGVRDLGSNTPLTPVGWAEDGTIEAVVHDSLPQYAVMWHVEREFPFVGHDLTMIQAIFAGR